MHTLTLADYVSLAAYFVAVIWIGAHFSKRQTTTREYFLAGKSMSWIPLGISMYASLFSSITYMSIPAEGYEHSMKYFLLYLAIPVAAAATVVLFVDVYSRLNITTIFEYLEMRYNGALRLLCALIYMVFRCFYAGIVLYTLSLALSVTTGLPMTWVLLAVGAVSILYTLMGGIEAVIWTDVLQFIVLAGGVALTLAFVVARLDGGWGELFSVAAASGKFQFADTRPFSFTERLTVVGILVLGFVDFLGNKGTDQMNVQRYLSGKSVSQSKGALLLAALVSAPVQFLLYMVGIGLFVYYLKSPRPDMYVSLLIAEGDQKSIFPYFIVSSIPPGVRGLLLGGLLAAAMSTLDSVLNTLSATCVTDIYRRWINPAADDRRSLAVSKLMIVFFGAALTAASFSFALRGVKSILVETSATLSVFMGQLLGVFVLGVLVRRATGWGVLIGALCGQATSLMVKFNLIYVEHGRPAFTLAPLRGWIGSLLPALSPVTGWFGAGVGPGLPGKGISFLWFSSIGVSVTVLVGFLASLLFNRPDYGKIGPTMWKWHGWRAAFGSGASAAKDEPTAGKEAGTS